MDNGKLKNILNLERRNLKKHLLQDDKVREFVAKLLKLSETASSTEIINNMERNDVIKQVSKYDKIHTKLVQTNLLIKKYDYRWMGVRFIPSNAYYLSQKSLGIIDKL